MSFLENILRQKEHSIQRKQKILPQEILIKKLKIPLKKSRFKNILEKPGTHLIAEIKRASPSRGDIRKDFDVVRIANIYEKQGVELVSVLTEEKFFKGSLEDLLKVRQNTGLSILCKDFIIDEYQIYEAKLSGAEAVLLIVKILSRNKIKKFLSIAKKLKMDAVVEVHDEKDLKKILGLKAVEIIGINHRNLEDFRIDLSITKKLLPRIPHGKIIIAESGIESVSQIKDFKKLGVSGVLIGESLMREENIGAKLKEFKKAILE